VFGRQSREKGRVEEKLPARKLAQESSPMSSANGVPTAGKVIGERATGGFSIRSAGSNTWGETRTVIESC